MKKSAWSKRIKVSTRPYISAPSFFIDKRGIQYEKVGEGEEHRSSYDRWVYYKYTPQVHYKGNKWVFLCCYDDIEWARGQGYQWSIIDKLWTTTSDTIAKFSRCEFVTDSAIAASRERNFEIRTTFQEDIYDGGCTPEFLCGEDD